MTPTHSFLSNYIKVDTELFDKLIEYCCIYGGVIAVEVQHCEKSRIYQVHMQVVSEKMVFIGCLDESGIPIPNTHKYYTTDVEQYELLSGFGNNDDLELLSTFLDDMQEEKVDCLNLYVWRLTALKMLADLAK
jgi:hypothetical protein